MAGKFYTFAWCLSRFYYGIVYPHKVLGSENIPKDGAFILVANHISARDPLFLASTVPLRIKIRFMAKKELFKNPVMNKICTWLGAFPVDRGAADMSAIHTAMGILKAGEPLGIFPQGTRSKDNSRTPMLSGTSLIALRANAPVIPAYIDGPYRLFHRADVYFGKPVDLSVFGRRGDRETLNQATAMIEEAVWGLKSSKT